MTAPVSSPLGGVRAFDIDGERVDEGQLESEDGTLTLGLRDGLGTGAYVVTYRVISEDGHPITGAFTFTVGDAEQASDETVAGLLGSEDDRLWDIAGGIARFLAYGGTLLAAGVAIFAVTAATIDVGGVSSPQTPRKNAKKCTTHGSTPMRIIGGAITIATRI